MASCSTSSGSHRRSKVPRSPVFRSAIESLFKTWTALKLAIEHGQGGNKGKDIATWMIGAVEEYFYLNDDLMGSEVADFLGTLMNQELDTIVDDNSLDELGEKLSLYFRMCSDKKEAEVTLELEKLNNQPQTASSCAASKPLAVEDDSSSGDSGSEEEMETS